VSGTVAFVFAILVVAFIFDSCSSSTTHTITGAISGVGATQRISSVRWG